MADKPTYEELEQEVNKSGIIRKSIMHACFLLVVIVCVFICPPAYAGKEVVQTIDKYKILILNSYHKEFEWTDGQVSAAVEVLTTNLKNPALYVEYMDTKRIYNEEYLSLFYETLRLKYRNVKFNAIITTDDNALRFVLQHNKELFGDVPVVFCGINGYSNTLLAGRTLFTGMIEVLDIIPTIDLALKLHPGTRKIVVINDSTNTGMWIRKEVKAAISHYQDMQFEFLKGEEHTTEELLEKLRLLPNNNIVLNTVWLRDKAEKFISTHDGVSLISSNSAVPVYGLFGNHLGSGIIGGKLLYSKNHGKIAAEMVVRILSGERPNDIPVLMESANPFMFDYEQLDRWNIKVSDLPENSYVINKHFSLYEEYKGRIWSVIAVLLIFSATIFILATNILRRSKAEEALKESEKRFRSIIENTDAGYFFIDKDGLIQDVNKSWLKMYKYPSPDEIIGKHFTIIQKADDVERAKEFVNGIMRGDIRYLTGEFSRKCKDDTIGYHTFSARPAFRFGEIIGIEGFIIDSTARKFMEQRLRASKQEWESTFNSMTDWVSLTDLNYRILRSNLAGEKFTRMPTEEMIGRICCELTHGSKEPIPGCPMQKMLQTYKREAVDRYVPDTNRWLRIMVEPVVDDDGNIIRAVHIVRDITYFKKIEEEQLKVKKLESVGFLAGGIAHDFNNLLYIIMGNISMTKDDVKPEYGVTDFLNAAEEASLKAKELANQLITFSKGGAPVKKISSIGNLVKETTNIALSGSNVKSELIFPDDLWRVEFDEGQMKHTVKNLIVNAVESMPDGGSIVLKAENFNISSGTIEKSLPLSEGKYLKISVQDHGVGIPEEHLLTIFDPYFSTKERGIQKGMGGKEAIKDLLEINPQVKAIVSSGYLNDPVMTNFRRHGFIEALSKPYTVKDLSETLNKITKD